MARKQEPLLIATKTATITNTMVALAVLVLGAASLAAAAALTNLNSPRGTIVLAGDSTIPCTTTSTPPITTPSSTPKITSVGSLQITAVSDSTTASSIKVPQKNKYLTQLGKWSLTAKDEPIMVKHIRLALVDKTYTLKKNASEFDSLILSITDPSLSGMEIITTGLNNGYIDADINGLVVNPDKPVSLILRGYINDSGIMTPGAIEAFAVSNSGNTGWVAVGASSGNALKSDQITASPSVFGWNGLSTFYLYHNSALSFSAGKLGAESSLMKPSSESLIMPVTVSTIGERDIRLGKIIVAVDTSGLASYTSSSTGMITNFKLFESKDDGSPLILLGTVNTCITGGDKTVHGTVKVGTKSCYVNSATLIFDKNNSSGLNSFVIPQNQARSLRLTADTTSALVGDKTSGVSIKGTINGKKGWQQHPTDPKRSEWGQGSFYYYYTPVGGKENAMAYTASDSYPYSWNTVLVSK